MQWKGNLQENSQRVAQSSLDYEKGEAAITQANLVVRLRVSVYVCVWGGAYVCATARPIARHDLCVIACVHLCQCKCTCV